MSNLAPDEFGYITLTLIMWPPGARDPSMAVGPLLSRHLRAFRAERPLENPATRSDLAFDAFDESRSGVGAVDDPVDCRSPRALTHTGCAPLGQMPDNAGALARRKRPTLYRREPAAGDFLNLGECAAELPEVAIRQRRQQSH